MRDGDRSVPTIRGGDRNIHRMCRHSCNGGHVDNQSTITENTKHIMTNPQTNNNTTNNENMYPLNDQALEVLSGIKHLIQTYELDEIIALIDKTLNSSESK
jgi:hypothetical protein